MRPSLNLTVLLQIACTALYLQHKTENSGRRTSIRSEQHATRQSLNVDLPAHIPPRPTPWWTLPNTNNGEMNALTGQQLHPFDDGDDGFSNDYDTDKTDSSRFCHIKRCQSSGNSDKHRCGQHARCLRNYCQCDFGWKPGSDTPTARGWTGLEALTVWIDAYVAGCTERCDNLSCLEVPQTKDCFANQIAYKNDNIDGATHTQMSLEDLAVDSLHLGAIKAPVPGAGDRT